MGEWESRALHNVFEGGTSLCDMEAHPSSLARRELAGPQQPIQHRCWWERYSQEGGREDLRSVNNRLWPDLEGAGRHAHPAAAPAGSLLRLRLLLRHPPLLLAPPAAAAR